MLYEVITLTGDILDTNSNWLCRLVHGVRVHDPGHHSLVRIDIGCWNVGLRAKLIQERCCESAGDTLELTDGELRRVAHDSPVGSAKRNVDHRALPGRLTSYNVCYTKLLRS